MVDNMQNSTYRQKKIIEILTMLHEGGNFEDAKAIFDATFDGVDVSEITSAEKELIGDGLNPAEIQRLCNVHAAVFKGSISDIHHSNYEYEQPGHPVHTIKLENRVIKSLLHDEIEKSLNKYIAGDAKSYDRLVAALKDLQNIDAHYARKENFIFTYMEVHEITAPPKVMWGVDDSIRAAIKQAYLDAKNHLVSDEALKAEVEHVINEVDEMIFKEEEIMIPMTLEAFTSDEWAKIAAESGEIGYSFIPEPLPWKPAKKKPTEATAKSEEPLTYDWEQTPGLADGNVILPTGILNLKELKGLFNAIPLDLTFVDKDDKVRFFSEGRHQERIFPRAKSVIGRDVINCHPPKSLKMVQKILSDFKDGSSEHADFWIDMHGKMIYIRYFAVRDANTNEYLGCLEVTQDITGIRELEGQKRLMDTDE